ncbi:MULTISPECIES: BRO family protein [unclassified Streptomyces]|uniref:BRO family protein n=1 Tax=unclassified Streptomyces TaxID=2593676 RepID=UPI002E2DF190|nr:BRO family protein [Streptomyces sp. NBC_00228]
MSSNHERQPALHTFPVTGQQVRTVVRDGILWWVASDVAAVLDIGRTHDAVRSLDEDEKGAETIRTPGGEQPVSVINEAGLYSLILRSRKLEARAFKRWVTHEVIPTLRTSGRYEVERPEPSKLELARDLVAALEVKELLQQRNAELEPSAAAWDTLASESVGDYSMRAAAQLLDRDGCVRTGQNRLARTLRELGWTDSHGEPYQSQVDAGRLVRRVTSYRHPRTGERMPSTQTRITVRGLAALRDRLGCRQTLMRFDDTAA